MINSKTINRGYLKRLIERGEIEMISSYHFDDQMGESRSKEPLPVRIGSYGDMKQGYCNLYKSDLSSSCGGAYQNPDGTIHLHVHSNCFYDFRHKNGNGVKPQSEPQFKVDEQYRVKVQEFADRVDAQQTMQLIRDGFGSQVEANRVKVMFGKKYARVDVGSSGRYMVDREGNIFGIKAYGVPHRGYRYGTLDTLDQWNFGGYSATRVTQ